MKLLRYRLRHDRLGRSSALGVLTNQGVVGLSGRALELAELGNALDLQSRTKIEALVNEAFDFIDPDDVEYLPPLAARARIFCVGLNYHDHVSETKRDLPTVPSIFMRTAEGVVGHGGQIIRPNCSEQLDFEGELAVIIGEPGRNIEEADAALHIAGYACFDDGSIRDFQRQSTTVGKNFDASGAFGPYIVTADDVPNLPDQTLTTRVNGSVMQHSPFSGMIYSVPQIISYVSKFTRLQPGDVISTGTPAGVGSRRIPPVWLKPEDVVEIDISGIGILKVTVVAE